MQVGCVRELIALSLILNACGSNQSDEKSERMCRIDSSDWHSGSISPPNRVLSWTVIIGDDDLIVNGRLEHISNLKNELALAREYRPSPYLIIRKEAGTSCDRFSQVVKTLDDAIDCEKNYCFYSTGAT